MEWRRGCSEGDRRLLGMEANCTGADDVDGRRDDHEGERRRLPEVRQRSRSFQLASDVKNRSPEGLGSAGAVLPSELQSMVVSDASAEGLCLPAGDRPVREVWRVCEDLCTLQGALQTEDLRR